MLIYFLITSSTTRGIDRIYRRPAHLERHESRLVNRLAISP